MTGNLHQAQQISLISTHTHACTHTKSAKWVRL